MSDAYLIDGYNLIHALGLVGKRVAPGQLEAARRRLLTQLRQNFDKLRGAVTVVFDAKRKPRWAPPDGMVGGIQVLFAVGREADDLLEERIAAHPHPRRLHVVSDDHRVQEAARRRRAVPLGCQEFLDRLDQPNAPGPRPSRSKRPEDAPMSEEERQHWLRTFGDVEIPDELRDAFD